MEPHDIIKYPLSTEKCIRLLEAENKLVFVVRHDATRRDVKQAVEKMFKVKVKKVNTLSTITGEKKAYVTLSQESPAIDVATELGLI